MLEEYFFLLKFLSGFIGNKLARDYMEYLEKAYMLAINKFDYSLKKQQANARKYYSIDLGLSNLLRVPNVKTKGHDLESGVEVVNVLEWLL